MKPRATESRGRHLVVDHGNTLLKATLFESGRVSRTLATADPAELAAMAAESAPVGVAYSPPGPVDGALVEMLRDAAGTEPLVVSHKVALPIAVDYATPATLGLDRVAGAAGAAMLWPDGADAIVVDAGTAVTIDLLRASACFAGGRISPGLRLRFRVLHEYTAALPTVQPDGDLRPYGLDTPGCIRAGVVGGLLSEIAGAADAYAGDVRPARMVFTGGDAPFLLDAARRLGVTLFDGDIHCEPNLVAYGLLSILRFNENDI